MACWKTPFNVKKCPGQLSFMSSVCGRLQPVSNFSGTEKLRQHKVPKAAVPIVATWGWLQKQNDVHRLFCWNAELQQWNACLPAPPPLCCCAFIWLSSAEQPLVGCSEHPVAARFCVNIENFYKHTRWRTLSDKRNEKRKETPQTQAAQGERSFQRGKDRPGFSQLVPDFSYSVTILASVNKVLLSQLLLIIYADIQIISPLKFCNFYWN